MKCKRATTYGDIKSFFRRTTLRLARATMTSIEFYDNLPLSELIQLVNEIQREEKNRR
jgi:hypothetical protein